MRKPMDALYGNIVTKDSDGSFQKLGGTLFGGPYNKDPTI